MALPDVRPRHSGNQVSKMGFSGISRLFLVLAVLSLGGCSWGGGSGSMMAPDKAAAQNTMIMELTDLRRRLATESVRAADAEKEIQRVRAEVDWLARAAQEGPQLEARVSELDAEVARLSAENKRITVLEANLRQMEAENDRLSRALRGDWSERPAKNTPGAAPAIPAPVALLDGGDFGEGNYAAHLASYRSAQAALDGWHRLRGLYPNLLGALSGHVAIFDVASLGGRFYRLKAGPFAGAGAAQVLCRSLNDVGEYCVITVFDGEQLPE